VDWECARGLVIEVPTEWLVNDGPAKGCADEEDAGWRVSLVLVAGCEGPES
jgi:hypothetical protein